MVVVQDAEFTLGILKGDSSWSVGPLSHTHTSSHDSCDSKLVWTLNQMKVVEMTRALTRYGVAGVPYYSKRL